MALAFGHMLKIMYDVNGNGAYLDKAIKMHTYFRNNLSPNGNAYAWNYSDRPGSPPEDTSHGHVDMASVFECTAAASFTPGTTCGSSPIR